MLWVVDASVAAKWFIPELHKDKADQLLRDFLTDKAEFTAPDLLVPEMGNLLCSRCKRGDMTPTEAAERYRTFLSLNIPLHPSSPLAAAALPTAISEHRSVYDMLYVTLAQQKGCSFVTADQKLVNALGKKFACIQWIGDL
jgi:predicted nucleic acid-binding protein